MTVTEGEAGVTQAINDHNFGAWVIKCDPKVWDLEASLDAGENYIDDWSVKDNYRTRRMAPGDPIVFWVSGPANTRLAAGVWGVGYVTAPVNIEATTEAQVPDLQIAEESGYWLDLNAMHRARFFVKTDIRLMDTPITRDLIRLVPELAEIEPIRQPQMSNPSWLNITEWVALQGLLGDGALEPVDPTDLRAVHGHEEVPAGGQLRSPPVAMKSPHLWPREVPTPR
jgi:EVE domain